MTSRVKIPGRALIHTQAVAARADGLTPAVPPTDDRMLLVVAAWWHDLGYAPALRDTGCHQIDGARYPEREGYPERLVALVAHHSAATCEADERGLLDELEVWPCETDDPTRVLRALDDSEDDGPRTRWCPRDGCGACDPGIRRPTLR